MKDLKLTLQDRLRHILLIVQGCWTKMDIFNQVELKLNSFIVQTIKDLVTLRE